LLPVRFLLSSYAPLFAILVLRLDSAQVSVGCGALAAIGLLSTISLLGGVGRLEPEPHKVDAVVDRGPEVAGYVATYLLPFVTVAEPSGRDLLAYGAFLVVSGIIYVRSSMMAVNPLLYLLGFRVVSITNGTGLDAFLVCRARPEPGTIVRASEVVPGVLFRTER